MVSLWQLVEEMQMWRGGRLGHKILRRVRIVMTTMMMKHLLLVKIWVHSWFRSFVVWLVSVIDMRSVFGLGSTNSSMYEYYTMTIALCYAHFEHDVKSKNCLSSFNNFVWSAQTSARCLIIISIDLKIRHQTSEDHQNHPKPLVTGTY